MKSAGDIMLLRAAERAPSWKLLTTNLSTETLNVHKLIEVVVGYADIQDLQQRLLLVPVTSIPTVVYQ